MVTGCIAGGRFLGRVCVLSFRTHQPQIDALVDDMTASISDIRAAAGITPPGGVRFA
jgi:aromatic-L-amino-acid decarboxylase